MLGTRFTNKSKLLNWLIRNEVRRKKEENIRKKKESIMGVFVVPNFEQPTQLKRFPS